MTAENYHELLANPVIQEIAPRQLMGIRRNMSLTENGTFALWQAFMKQKNRLSGPFSDLLYSLQCYPPGYFEHFNPDTTFEKWAATEMDVNDHLPEGMELFLLKGGLYAVFIYKGTADKAVSVFVYIFRSWLPESGYLLDDRPHFERMGVNYDPNDPTAEEEIWIPVKRKDELYPELKQM